MVNPWRSTVGPAGATVMTMSRLNWHSDDGRIWTDELNQRWDLTKDPPAAVASAVRRAAKTWAFEQSIGAVPNARISSIGCQEIMVDCTDGLHGLASCTKAACKRLPWRERKFWPYAVSLMGGGQWTQQRKSVLRDWAHGNLCQLCHEQVGTLEHRWTCRELVPTDGLPSPEPKIKPFAESLPAERFAAMRDRGMLVVTITPPPQQEQSRGLEWILKPEDPFDDSLR